MDQIKSYKFTLLWLLLGIPIISYLLLKKTFNLALYGDDWLQLYNIWLSFDIHKSLSFFDIKSYLGAYLPQYFFLGIIRHFFGYQDQAYFAASLILRIFATASIFFLVKELSKSQLASFLATIIFIFSAAGLETTDWVFNMNTYAGIFFLNLALVIYLKIRALQTFVSWYYLAYFLLFTLALGVVPVRMHGALPFILITELFLYIFIEKKKLFSLDRFLIARIALSVTIMFTLIKFGSFGSEGEILPVLKTNFFYVQDMIWKGRFDILFYFFGTIGNVVIPDKFNTEIFYGHLSPMVVFFTLLGLIISIAVKGDRFMYIGLILLNTSWALIGKLLILSNPNLSIGNLFSISVGFQFLFLSFLIFRHTHKTYPKLSILIMVGVFWIIFFLLLYWLRTPYLIIDTTGRYMTMGTVGFSIIFAGILSIMINYLKSTHIIRSISLIVPFLLLTSWLIINFKATQSYLTNLETNRNLALADKTWSNLKRYVPTLDKDSPSVFYFTYDNSTAANMILIFGFWPHAGLSYGISDWEKTPLPTESYVELLGMVRTGEPLKRIHARKLIPVPLSRVFAFDFRNGDLINITEAIRQKLLNDISVTTPIR